MGKAIIFLNGYINLDFCESYLYNTSNKESYDIYCTDGAFLKVMGSKPIMSDLKMISGDFDTLPINIRVKIRSSIKVLPTPDQNYTDFEKLLGLLDGKYKQVDVYGAGGNEMDHFLGALSIALKWINKIKIVFIDQYSKYEVAKNNFKRQNVLNKMVSIMPLSRMCNVNFQGLKYSLNGQDLEIGKLVSTRNTAVANEIVINCSEGSFVIFISHDNY